MTFSSIMTFLCVVYVLAYGGMITYDLFFSKEGVELAPVFEEEEIDISDEAAEFSPILIEKEEPPPRADTGNGNGTDEVVAMTGGVELSDLLPKLEDLAVNGRDSDLGAVINDWSEYYDVA